MAAAASGLAPETAATYQLTHDRLRVPGAVPVGPDETPYRLLTTDGVSTFEAAGHRFLQVEPEALTLLTREAMRDIAHLLRPGHLAQLAAILDDPEASANDRFVALELLKNANIAAGGVLPVVPGHRHRHRQGQEGPVRRHRRRRRGGHRPRHLRDLPARPTCATRRWRRSTCTRRSTPAPTCPAEIKISAVDGDAYKFLFMAKGGGSANKSYLFQETKALLNPASLLQFLDEKIRTLGTAACPPYHLAIVIGGTSAEIALEDGQAGVGPLPRHAPARPATSSAAASATSSSRPQVLELTQRTGIGAQFGGKYFCHDVRVIRLPRHGASLPGRPSPCRARPTARRWARSPPTASSSSSSRPTRPGTCPRPPTTDLERRGRAHRPQPPDERDPRRAVAATR